MTQTENTNMPWPWPSAFAGNQDLKKATPKVILHTENGVIYAITASEPITIIEMESEHPVTRSQVLTEYEATVQRRMVDVINPRLCREIDQKLLELGIESCLDLSLSESPLPNQ